MMLVAWVPSSSDGPGGNSGRHSHATHLTTMGRDARLRAQMSVSLHPAVSKRVATRVLRRTVDAVTAFAKPEPNPAIQTQGRAANHLISTG